MSFQNLFCALFAAGFLWTSSIRAQGPENKSPLTLNEVLAAVEQSNPDIRAARQNAEAAGARVGPAGTWDFPKLSYSREKFPGGGRADHRMVEQDIAFPGKKRIEAAMKRHEASLAQSRYRAKALGVLALARILYHKLYRSDQLISQLSQNVDVMKATLRVQTRMQSTVPEKPANSSQPAAMGSSSPSMGADAFSLMTELGQMENMLFKERQARIMAAYELNSLMDRDLDAPIGTASSPSLADIPKSLQQLLRASEQNGPEYLSAMHEERHARAMLARSRLGWAPDLGLKYDWMREETAMRGSEAGISATVPLWISRPLGETREAKAHMRETEAIARAMRNEVRKMVALEFTETSTHLTSARNYRDSILPSAESALKLARRQYESGGNYLRLQQSLRTLISVQNEYYDEIYHYGEHWALLEQWAGVPLTPRDPGEKSHD